MTLKDAMVWLLLAAIALVMTVVAEARPKALIALGVAAALLLVALGYTRTNTFVVACWAVALAGWVGSPRSRWVRAAGAVVLAVALPWMVGYGPAGWALIAGKNPASMRVLNALGADSAVVDTSLDDGGIGELEEGASLAPNLRHLPRGVSVMLLEPYPWNSGGSTSLRFARLETILWYPLLGLALVGVFRLRTHLSTLLFPVVAGGATVLVYALTEGNLGTAYRHRGEFVWVVALLASAGLAHLSERRSARRARITEPAYGSGRERSRPRGTRTVEH